MSTEEDCEIDKLINANYYPANYQTEITTVYVWWLTQNIVNDEINKLTLSSFQLWIWISP